MILQSCLPTTELQQTLLHQIWKHIEWQLIVGDQHFKMFLNYSFCFQLKVFQNYRLTVAIPEQRGKTVFTFGESPFKRTEILFGSAPEGELWRTILVEEPGSLKLLNESSFAGESKEALATVTEFRHWFLYINFLIGVCNCLLNIQSNSSSLAESTDTSLEYLSGLLTYGVCFRFSSKHLLKLCSELEIRDWYFKSRFCFVCFCFG